MFNVILFTDTPEMNTRTRGYGVHRLATHIRERGYSCLVIDFMSGLNFETYKNIIDLALGKNTYMVGISTTWLPFRMPTDDQELQTHDPGRETTNEGKDEFLNEEQDHFKDKMILAVAKNEVHPWFEYIKEKNSQTKICLGGSAIGMYLDIKLVDNLFIGYSETMLIEYLDSLSGKSTKRIWNKVIDHDPKAQAPIWDYTISQTQYTEYDFIQPQEPLALEVGRGCRFKCKYCSYPLIGMKNINSYLKKADVLRDELVNNYEKHGTNRYFIIDDTFNDSVYKIKYFLDVVKSLPFKIYYWCYLRLDLLSAFPEMIPMLQESGMIQCYFGIETFNHTAGKAVGKGGNPQKMKDTLYKCKEIWKNNVNIQAGFMVGLPHEDSKSIMQTAEWLAKDDCPIDIKWIFPLSIAGPSEVMKYTYTSEFDRNYAEYGYSIPDFKEFWKWAKDDETDINSSQKAEEVSLKAEKNIKNKLFTRDLNAASLPHPILSNIEETGKLTEDEYRRILDTIDKPSLYQKSVTEDYFKPLIEKLRIERNISSVAVNGNF